MFFLSFFVLRHIVPICVFVCTSNSKSGPRALLSLIRQPDVVVAKFEVAQPTGAALLDNNEATAKSTSQDGGMAGNFG